MRVGLGGMGRRRASQTGLSNLSPSLSRLRYSFERMTSREKRRFLSLFLCVVVVVASVCFFMGDTAVFFCLFVFVAALRLLVVS